MKSKCKICQRIFEGKRITARICSPECAAQNRRDNTYKLNTRLKPRERKTIYSGPHSPKRDLIRFYDLIYLNLEDSELGFVSDRQIRETAKYFWLSRQMRLIEHGIRKCDRTIKKEMLTKISKRPSKENLQLIANYQAIFNYEKTHTDTH